MSYLTVGRRLLISSLMFATAACSNTLTNFVERVKPDEPAPMRAPVIAPRGPMRIASGPGVVDATAGNVRMRAAINRNGALVGMGGDRRARIYLNQSHAEQ